MIFTSWFKMVLSYKNMKRSPKEAAPRKEPHSNLNLKAISDNRKFWKTMKVGLSPSKNIFLYLLQ